MSVKLANLLERAIDLLDISSSDTKTSVQCYLFKITIIQSNRRIFEKILISSPNPNELATM